MEVNIMTILKPKDVADRLGITTKPSKHGIERVFLKLSALLLIADSIQKIK